MCASCDRFEGNGQIHGPAQLSRIIARLQSAVRSEVLDCSPIGSDSTAVDQKPFLDLDPDNGLPDVLIYDFRCNECGATFGLRVETYHGQGGSWSRL